MNIRDAASDTGPGETPAAVVCAWCKTVLREGSQPPSHGICGNCLAERFRGPAESGKIDKAAARGESPGV